MKKLAVTVLATFALVGVVMGSRALAVKAKDAPASVTISDCKAKQGAVTFDHKKHFTDSKIACDTCHHTDKGMKAGGSEEVKKCGDCHMPGKDPKAPSCQEMGAAKNPFHKLCVTCHKAKGGSAPAKCGDCHKK